MGLSGDKLAAKFGVTREESDEFAVRSHNLAAKAIEEVNLLLCRSPVRFIVDGTSPFPVLLLLFCSPTDCKKQIGYFEEGDHPRSSSAESCQADHN